VLDLLEIPSIFNVKAKKKSSMRIEMITVEDNINNNKSNNKPKHHQARRVVHFIATTQQTPLHKMYIEKLVISYEGQLNT
jgi:hypothetical protein